MAKKYNRSRPQKRNVDRRKLEQYREEIARELGVELPRKKDSAQSGDCASRENPKRDNDDSSC